MGNNLNQEAFSKLDTIKYAGKCIGLVDGKIVMTSKDPNKVIKKLNSFKKKEIGVICIPSSKNAMVL